MFLINSKFMKFCAERAQFTILENVSTPCRSSEKVFRALGVRVG